MALRQLILLILLYAASLFAQSGELYELQNIEFNGNTEISSSVLETIIYSEETPWWFYKFLNSFTGLGKPAVYFDSSSVQIDIDALKAFYKANGFFETRISYSYTADSISKEISLTYIIDENSHFNYGDIRLRGLDTIPEHISKRIYAEIGITSEQAFEQTKTEESIAHILEILINRGFLMVKHDSTVVYIDTLLNTAGLDIFFTHGRRYKVSEIIIDTDGDGASHVSNNLLEKLIDIPKEEYYNHSKIRTSQARLVRTGLFHSVNLNASRQDTSGDYVPLRLDGNIGKMNEFMPGVSMNHQFNSFNLGFNANYSRKNFLGEARKLTLSGEFAVVDIAAFDFKEFFSDRNYNIDGYAYVNVKIEQPYLFRKPILGTLENYFQTSTVEGLNEKTYGLKTLFEFEMPYYTLINQLRPYYNLEFYHARVKNMALEQDSIISANQFTRTSSLGVQLGSAKANNLFFPTGGYNQFISLEVAVSNGESDESRVTAITDSTRGIIQAADNGTTFFYRFETTTSFFVPLSLSGNAVFGSKTKIGYVKAFSGSPDQIPGNRTFFAGGSNSLRGWGARDLPSTASQTRTTLRNGVLADSTSSSDIWGGTFLFEGSFELRQRFLDNLGVILFTDYGNAWDGYQSFRFDEIALAAGLGIRYYSPIAPFRIDFGLRFYDPDEDKFIWNNWDKSFLKNFTFHFGIGEAF